MRSMADPTDLVPESLARSQTDYATTCCGANAWLVVVDLRNELAFGGFRFHPAVSLELVSSLARTMTWKLAAHGLPVGGAKAGLAADPKDPRMDEIDEFGEGSPYNSLDFSARARGSGPAQRGGSRGHPGSRHQRPIECRRRRAVRHPSGLHRSEHRNFGRTAPRRRNHRGRRRAEPSPELISAPAASPLRHAFIFRDRSRESRPRTGRGGAADPVGRASPRRGPVRRAGPGGIPERRRAAPVHRGQRAPGAELSARPATCARSRAVRSGSLASSRCPR